VHILEENDNTKDKYISRDIITPLTNKK
jgi:hypothetical protein